MKSQERLGEPKEIFVILSNSFCRKLTEVQQKKKHDYVNKNNWENYILLCQRVKLDTYDKHKIKSDLMNRREQTGMDSRL